MRSKRAASGRFCRCADRKRTIKEQNMNNITMTLQVDHLIMEALREDISSEDVTTNAVMHEAE